ncbi:ParA family protein [Streptomyces mirabilis]|uniref:ParA family protein n=1 Tax=Streptomyces mirabilis TaxID=68239 RepID=UPI0033B988A8
MPFDILDISAEAEMIPRLRELPYDHVFVDTPGWTPPSLEHFEEGANPLGDADDVAQLLDSILEQAHDAIVPILTEPDSFDPTYQTVEWVLKPRGIVYQVVINNWPPSEGIAYVDGTRKLCDRHGWPVANTVIRRYRVHTNATKVVTQYNNNRVELQAREDFYRFALEHGLSGASDRLEQITREEASAS